MTKTFVIVIGALTAVLLILLLNQVRLTQRMDAVLAAGGTRPIVRSDAENPDGSQARLQQMEQRLNNLERSVRDLSSRPPMSEVRTPDLTVRAPRRIRPIEPGGFVPRLATAPRRPWSPEQVIGPPDTMQAGDQATAWASRSPDSGVEWLKVDYLNEVSIAEVRVRETYNPGAVVRIAAVLLDGSETDIWKGIEPPSEAPVDQSFPASSGNVRAKSVKIYLDCARVPGWNEIDAVELIGTDGSRQWASQASASSTYADVSYPLDR